MNEIIFKARRRVYPVIRKYYGEGDLLDLLEIHSECVARKALETAAVVREKIDLKFVAEASLLHDIGIIRCYAPDIYCNGQLPYICHGVAGREMLEQMELPRHALVCERHTGSGLSEEDIIRQKLPLPLRDMCPRSVEERLICYADKFFSKSGNPAEEKTLPSVEQSIRRHGEDSYIRFMALVKEFDSETGLFGK